MNYLLIINLKQQIEDVGGKVAKIVVNSNMMALFLPFLKRNNKNNQKHIQIIWY